MLKTIISNLRGALDDDAKQPRYIETASRRGYRFIAPLDAAPAGPGGPLPGPVHVDLVGRDVPLAVLGQAFAEACRGSRQLVLVAGEAGIGKSTLIDRFVGALPGGAFACATGQCVEHYGAGESYMPVLEALNMLGRGEHGAAMLALMRRVAPTWLAQLPWYLDDEDRRQLQREVAGATQDRMLRELGELLDRATADRPLLLVLEDLHWSDHATVQLLGYLARRRTPAALLLLGSFRPAEVLASEHPLAGMRQELRLHRLCRELDLESFSEVDLGALLAARIDGEAAPEAFVRALHAHTGGLPLFVVNVLDDLVADGSLRRDAAGWTFPDTAAFSIPRSVAGVIEKQIERLPAAQQRVLMAASVAGDEFVHLALPPLLEMEADTVREALDAVAASRQWLRATGVTSLRDGRLAAGYAFRHTLYRHVFYERNSLAQRMQAHRLVAATLLEVHGGAAPDLAAELAMHFERGGEAAAAACQLAVLAERALARGVARETLRAARHGLQLLEPLPEGATRDAAELELRVLEGIALTRLHVLTEPEVAAPFERAQVLCDQGVDTPARARALHGLWWVSFGRGELPRALALALAGRILDLGEATSDPALLLTGNSATGITLAMMGDLGGARRHLEVVIEVHDAVGAELPPAVFVQDPGVEARAYLGLVLWWSGEPGPARRYAAEAVELACGLRHPISQLIALHLAAVMHYFAGEDEAALVLLEQLIEVRSHGLPDVAGSFNWLHGHLIATRGEVEAGFAEMLGAERSCARVGMLIGLTGFEMHYAEACRDAGRLDEMGAAIERGLARAGSGQEHFLLVPLLRLRAEWQRARGDADAAAASLHEALSLAQAQGARFHELAVLVEGAHLATPPWPDLRARLGALLPDWSSETIALAEAARALVS